MLSTFQSLKLFDQGFWPKANFKRQDLNHLKFGLLYVKRESQLLTSTT